MRLTQASVKKLGEGVHTDDSVSGLRLRVRPDGRYWSLRRQINGRAHDVSLGSALKVTLQEARRKGALLNAMDDEEFERKTARRPKEPAPEKKPVLTFAETAERYCRWNIEVGNWREGERSETVPRGRLKNHILPHIGSIPLQEVEETDVAKIAQAVWGKPETVSRCLHLVKQIFDWAKANRLFKGDNPAATDGPLKFLMPKQKPEKRNQGALPVSRLPAFIATLENLGTSGARCLIFSILTATRSANARNARWENIDFEAGEWRIDRSEMKVKENGDLVVPLSPLVIKWLECLNPQEDGLVFHNRSGGSFSDNVFEAIIKRLNNGADDPWIDEEQTRRLGRTVRATQHGIARSTFRTWAQDDELGNDKLFDHRVAELCLHHKPDDRYNGAYERNHFEKRRREMMAAWAEFCFSVINAEEG